MGRIIVRKKIENKKAYEIPGLKIKVYTPEELVYAYYRNLPRLEPQIMDEALLSWLAYCGRESLSKHLAEYVNGSADKLPAFVGAVLSGISFYKEEEIQEAQKALQDWNLTDPYVRKKEKMDYLFENGRIREALTGYDEIIREGDRLSEEFLAAVYHNRGVVYARLFLFDTAAASFKRAWELSKATDSKELYMLSLRMSLPKESYVNRISEEELGEENAVELEEKLLELLNTEERSPNRSVFSRARKQKELGNQANYEEMLHELIEDLKQSWRNQYGDF